MPDKEYFRCCDNQPIIPALSGNNFELDKFLNATPSDENENITISAVE